MITLPFLKKDSYTSFLVLFLALFALLYYINVGFIGVTSPGNFYIPFLDKHLDYIDWLRSLILHASNFLTRLAGVESVVEEPYRLGVPGGAGVRMVYSCIGYGVMSLWVAFVLANTGPWKKKLLWIILGCFLILVINCFRVSMLLVALVKKWNVNAYIEHHTLFNIFSYLLIFLLIYLYTNKVAGKLEEG